MLSPISLIEPDNSVVIETPALKQSCCFSVMPNVCLQQQIVYVIPKNSVNPNWTETWLLK